MRKLILLLGTAALAACGQPNSNPAANQAEAKQTGANTAQPKPKPAYCFFKDSETKGWKASRDKDGNILIKGKAYRLDPRYKALLGPPMVAGPSAEITPTITVNDTGYAAPDNWWDVKAVIANSAAVDTVVVRCGAKVIATLKVPTKADRRGPAAAGRKAA
jgi:hypothetical protein